MAGDIVTCRGRPLRSYVPVFKNSVSTLLEFDAQIILLNGIPINWVKQKDETGMKLYRVARKKTERHHCAFFKSDYPILTMRIDKVKMDCCSPLWQAEMAFIHT